MDTTNDAIAAAITNLTQARDELRARRDDLDRQIAAVDRAVAALTGDTSAAATWPPAVSTTATLPAAPAPATPSAPKVGQPRTAGCGTASGYTTHRRNGEEPCDTGPPTSPNAFTPVAKPAPRTAPELRMDVDAARRALEAGAA